MQFKNIAFLVLVAVSYAACQLNDGGSPAKPKAPMTDAQRAAQERSTQIGAARYACRRSIKRSLHDPDSADWTPGYEWPVSVDGERVALQPSLRANNAYGGKVFQAFACVVDSSGDSSRVISLE